MAEPGKLELLHAEIDGELDPERRAALARALLSDPEVRKEREQLRQLCQALDRLEAVEPPAEMRGQILAALPQSAQRPRRAALRHWHADARWRYAAAMAGVLIAGAIVFESVRGPGPRATDVSGTLVTQGTGTLLDSLDLSDGPVSGRISLYRDHSALRLDLNVSAHTPVDVLITSGGQTLEFKGLGSRDTPGDVPTQVALPGFEAARSVEVRFLVDGRTVGGATLRAGH